MLETKGHKLLFEKQNVIKAVLFSIPIAIGLVSFQYQEAIDRTTQLITSFASFSATNPTVFAFFFFLMLSAILAMSYLSFKHLTESQGQREARTSKYYSNRNSVDYKKDFSDLIEKAKNIDVVGIGNSQFTSDVTLEFYEKLLSDNRCSIRILFLDPEGRQVRVREEDENHVENTLSLQVCKHLNYIDEFMCKLEKGNSVARHLFEHRFYDRYPTCNLIIFDGESVLVQHYLYSTRGGTSPIFNTSGKENWLVKFYTAEFDNLWKKARQPSNNKCSELATD